MFKRLEEGLGTYEGLCRKYKVSLAIENMQWLGKQDIEKLLKTIRGSEYVFSLLDVGNCTSEPEGMPTRISANETYGLLTHPKVLAVHLKQTKDGEPLGGRVTVQGDLDMGKVISLIREKPSSVHYPIILEPLSSRLGDAINDVRVLREYYS
jgi:L-ribulose-5-phosphate 3-epimerase UlaE